MRKGPVIAALYPVMMLLGQLAVATFFGLFVGAATGRFVQGLIGDPGWALPLYHLTRWIVAVAMAAVVLRWFKSVDNRLYAYYLMHDYAFSACFKGANPPQLERRMSDFGDQIAQALASDVDEVLIVGHSSGAHLAVSVLADLLRAGNLPKDGPQLAFLSLGHVVPMVSFLPQAQRLRADLAYLAVCPDITWVDVTAPGDGCCFALCDPVAVSGVAPAGQIWPLVISAAFSQSLSPARWKALRWRFFRLHFQYLCAFDQPKDYDYFQITAGPMTLRDRFAGRKPSRSRIKTPLSPFASVMR
jgi:hypothetical protein